MMVILLTFQRKLPTSWITFPAPTHQCNFVISLLFSCCQMNHHYSAAFLNTCVTQLIAFCFSFSFCTLCQIFTTIFSLSLSSHPYWGSHIPPLQHDMFLSLYHSLNCHYLAQSHLPQYHSPLWCQCLINKHPVCSKVVSIWKPCQN